MASGGGRFISQLEWFSVSTLRAWGSIFLCEQWCPQWDLGKTLPDNHHTQEAHDLYQVAMIVTLRNKTLTNKEKNEGEPTLQSSSHLSKWSMATLLICIHLAFGHQSNTILRFGLDFQIQVNFLPNYDTEFPRLNFNIQVS